MRPAFAAFALLISAAACSRGQIPRDTAHIDLCGLAAFRPGDDEVWRSAYIDEAQEWTFIPVPGTWERHGFPLLDGFAWYRTRFRIPSSLRDDSLLLVMSAVDDADEAYLNGALIGETGDFPPAVRREPCSLRVYPIPKALRGEHNSLAIRVYDSGESGGITGAIFRIIRASDLPATLDAVVDMPYRRPQLFISNGVAVSAIDPSRSVVDWSRPHLFHRFDNQLRTENTLSNLKLSVRRHGKRLDLSELECDTAGYLAGTGIVRGRYDGGAEVFWFHPFTTRDRILVAHARLPRNSGYEDPGFSAVFEKGSWEMREIEEDNAFELRRTFVLAWSSCCREFAERDLDNFLASPTFHGHPPHSVEAEHARWDSLLSERLYPPDALNDGEKAVYTQSVVALLLAQARPAGAGEGQITAAFIPDSRAVADPRLHLRSASALAETGALAAAGKALDFIAGAGAVAGAYALFSVYGEEFGVGYPYLVTPAHYTGDGGERIWPRPDLAELHFDGPAQFISAFESLRRNTVRAHARSGKPYSDSAFLAPRWPVISRRVADVLLYMRDSSGLIPHDASPWGPSLSRTPGIWASMHAAAALGTAARYAESMKDETRAYLYSRAADRTARTIRELAHSASLRERAADLTQLEALVFHPLLADGIGLGIFRPGSAEAEFAIQVVEQGFAVEAGGCAFSAQPDGDWFARQARPSIAMSLARAHLMSGNSERAEELFRSVTMTALKGGCLLPELIDPVTGNWYGGIPAIGEGAAEYILTAEKIAAARGK